MAIGDRPLTVREWLVWLDQLERARDYVAMVHADANQTGRAYKAASVFGQLDTLVNEANALADARLLDVQVCSRIVAQATAAIAALD